VSIECVEQLLLVIVTQRDFVNICKADGKESMHCISAEEPETKEPLGKYSVAEG
jgi:hypothetical protein